MTEITKKENSLFDVLSPTLAKAKSDTTKKKDTQVKLTSKDSTALKRIEKHSALSSEQFLLLAELLKTYDPNMKLMQQVAISVGHHLKPGISAALVEECARLVSAWFIDAELANKRSIFLSIWEDAGQSTSLQRFIDLLESQVKLRCKVLCEQVSQNVENSTNEIQSFDESQLLLNIKSIALTWLISKGLIQGDAVIDYLIERNSHDIEVTQVELAKLGLYVTENALPKRDVKFFTLLKHQKLQQVEIFRAKSIEVTKRKQLENELQVEQQKGADYKTQNAILEEKVLSLESSLDEMKKQLEQQQALGKAERVHLKDDHGKVRHKTLNALQDSVLPLLDKTSHALNKDVPKVHVATHQLELITEEIEGMILWLKK